MPDSYSNGLVRAAHSPVWSQCENVERAGLGQSPPPPPLLAPLLSHPAPGEAPVVSAGGAAPPPLRAAPTSPLPRAAAPHAPALGSTALLPTATVCSAVATLPPSAPSSLRPPP